MNLENILQELKKSGCRKTPLREVLLEILLEKERPVSVPEISTALNEKGLSPNVATLYRQLETLQKHGIIQSVLLDPKMQHFEIHKDHHHHFVCENCDIISDLHSPDIESAFHRFENELRDRGLIVKKHELTFFGECVTCD